MLLLTRPRDASEELAIHLDALGIANFINPVLEMQPVPLSMPQFDACMQADALIITSRYALANALYFPPLLQKPLLCVGEDSAERARRLGFTRVDSAGGDVTSLKSLLEQRRRQALVYLRGQDISEPLAPTFNNIIEMIVYAAEPARQLSPTLPLLVRNRMLSGISLFSRRSVAIFASLIDKAGLTSAVGALPFLCFSEGIAERVKTWNSGALCHVSHTPTRQDFLKLAQSLRQKA